MEGEINTLRATVTEQMTQVTALKVRRGCDGGRCAQTVSKAGAHCSVLCTSFNAWRPTPLFTNLEPVVCLASESHDLQPRHCVALQEDLAARKADASHFKQVTTDQKGQIEHLKRSLDSANSQLRETSQQLNQVHAQCIYLVELA